MKGLKEGGKTVPYDNCDVKNTNFVFVLMLCSLSKEYQKGPVRESNPGPLAPEARIIPLDQQADAYDASVTYRIILHVKPSVWSGTRCLKFHLRNDVS